MALHLAAADGKRKREIASAADADSQLARPRLFKHFSSPSGSMPASGLPSVTSSSTLTGKPSTARPSPGDLKAFMHQLISPASAAHPSAGRERSHVSPNRRQKQAHPSQHAPRLPDPVNADKQTAAGSLAAGGLSNAAAAQPAQPNKLSSNTHTFPEQQAAAADGRSLSAANVAWDGGKQKQRKKLLSRMQPHATSEMLPAASSAAEPAANPAETPAAEFAMPGHAARPQGSSLRPKTPQLQDAELDTGSDQLRQSVLKKHALGQPPLVQEPKVASSDSTDSVIAFP